MTEIPNVFVCLSGLKLSDLITGNSTYVVRIISLVVRVCFISLRAGPAKRLIICQPGLTLPFLRVWA